MIFPDDMTFEDVRLSEARQRQEHVDFLQNLKLAVGLCDDIMRLESTAGFKSLEETLRGMLAHRTTELLSARDNRTTAVLQGRCQELRSILSIMGETRGRREALALAIKNEEDRFREVERSFKPIPQEQPS